MNIEKELKIGDLLRDKTIGNNACLIYLGQNKFGKYEFFCLTRKKILNSIDGYLLDSWYEKIL